MTKKIKEEKGKYNPLKISNYKFFSSMRKGSDESIIGLGPTRLTLHIFEQLKSSRARFLNPEVSDLDYKEMLDSRELNPETYKDTYKASSRSFFVSLIVFAFCIYSIVTISSDSFILPIMTIISYFLITLMSMIMMFAYSFKCFQMRNYRNLGISRYFAAVLLKPLEIVPTTLPTRNIIPNKKSKATNK